MTRRAKKRQPNQTPPEWVASDRYELDEQVRKRLAGDCYTKFVSQHCCGLVRLAMGNNMWGSW